MQSKANTWKDRWQRGWEKCTKSRKRVRIDPKCPFPILK